MRLRRILLLQILCLLVGGSCSSEKTIAPTRDPASINYVQRMDVAAKELGWCKTYYQSFNSTSSPSYISLSANHCLTAIRSYHSLQQELSRYTTQHYYVRRQKLKTCKFYQNLEKSATKYKVYIEEIDSGICIASS